MMTLFSSPTCPFSQSSRIVLHEKGCEFCIESLDLEGISPEHQAQFEAISPYRELPVLIERDLILYNVFVINEYIDERFPHPQLMPADPVGRGRTRLFLNIFERDLFPHVRVLENTQSTEAQRETARRSLIYYLNFIAQRIGPTKFIMSDDFQMLDAVLAPILWRLQHYGITLPNESSKLSIYAERLFTRQSFIDSMTAQERSMRK